MTLSEYIKAYRDSHDLSQRQFASICGVSNGYISMLENGKNPKTGDPITPSPQTVQAIARGMGMTMQELLSEVDDLYLDLTGEEKQPAVPGELSEVAIEVAKLVDRLPPESRLRLLAAVQALVQSTPDPAASE